MNEPKRHRGVVTTTVEIDVLVQFCVEQGTPEYIPPYSKPENYDPGSPTTCEIHKVLFKLGHNGPMLDIEPLLSTEQIEDLQDWILEEGGHSV